MRMNENTKIKSTSCENKIFNDTLIVIDVITWEKPQILHLYLFHTHHKSIPSSKRATFQLIQNQMSVVVTVDNPDVKFHWSKKVPDSTASSLKFENVEAKSTMHTLKYSVKQLMKMKLIVAVHSNYVIIILCSNYWNVLLSSYFGVNRSFAFGTRKL